MKYSNIVAVFNTDPGGSLSTSRYYVFVNGLIRAKFADGEMHVRPGKNICYVAGSVKDVDADDGDSALTIDKTPVAFATLMSSGGGYQTPSTGSAPVDYYLDSNGNADGGPHHGHEITPTFSATYKTIPIVASKFDSYIAAGFVDKSDSSKLPGSLKYGNVSVAEYFKWLQTH